MKSKTLLLSVGMFLISQTAFSEVSHTFKSMELNLGAEPDNERMAVSADLEIELAGELNGQEIELTWVMTKPTSVDNFIDADSGENIDYRFQKIPSAPDTIGIQLLFIKLKATKKNYNLRLSYFYDSKSFVGWALNPATNDNLHLGQITKDSIYSSHLYYYPSDGIGPLSANIKVKVPKDWVATSSGVLAEQNGENFRFDFDSSSGQLPYPISIYPYKKIDFNYGKLPVSIFFDERDRSFAAEKENLIKNEILPFLEKLMGSYPFKELKIIEVFPKEGNTGLAAKGVVMLSQKMWFAAPIDSDLTSIPATVLVDEIAHQWNFYGVQFPNFLAEGISEYTDNLFIEKVKGSAALEKNIVAYLSEYQRIAGLLNQLNGFYKNGKTIEEVSQELGVPIEELRPYWNFAPYGERPIVESDQGTVFPALYFIKGALAIHALRRELGDANFYPAFRHLFQSLKGEQGLTLESFKANIEKSTNRDLQEFFNKWYFLTGLPN